jgi:hypothetical protein
MAIELMLLAVNLNFVAFSHYLGDVHGQVFVFFVLTVAAAESAIGLAILVTLFRSLHTINVEDLDALKAERVKFRLGCYVCTTLSHENILLAMPLGAASRCVDGRAVRESR